MAARRAVPRSRALARVAVGSDQPLVAESVAAALHNRGFDPVVVAWPREGPRPDRRTLLRRPRRRAAGPPPEVGLVVTDLLRVEQVHSTSALVAGLGIPWLVMAGVPRGAAWGGLYERGVQLVVTSDTGLDDVCVMLTDLAAGRQPAGQRKRRELIQAWNAFASQRAELSARLQTLTDREEEVLKRLHEGLAVRSIAESSEVTEATVRSQVKAILRKLDVNSQLAAVAAYENLLADSTHADVGG
jgi:DNA-binding NarL/FixJ family response regulator